MGKMLKFVPLATVYGWMLSIPPRLSDTGKRQKEYYAKKEDALARGEYLRNLVRRHGEARTVMSARDEADAIAALDLLRARVGGGATLLGVLADWLEWRELVNGESVEVRECLKNWVKAVELAGGGDVMELARAEGERRSKARVSETVANGVAEWLETHGELREATAASYRWTGRRLVDGLGERLLADLTGEDLQLVLEGRSLGLHRRNARVFWRWAAKRGWCEAGVFEEVALPERGRGGEIGVLSAEEAEALLRTVEEYAPEHVWRYVVSIFAGVRTEERERLGVANFSEDGIELGAEVTKKGRRRHVGYNEPLRAWLAVYPPTDVRLTQEVDRGLRKLAGWDVVCGVKRWKYPKVARFGRWKTNCMRHTHASVAMALGARLEDLLFEFGHTDSGQMLRQHYVGRMTKREAAAIWGLRPRGWVG